MYNDEINVIKNRLMQEREDFVLLARFCTVMGEYVHVEMDERVGKVLKVLDNMPKIEIIHALLTCLRKIEGKQLDTMEHTDIWSENSNGDVLFYWEDGGSISRFTSLLRLELRSHLGLPQ